MRCTVSCCGLHETTQISSTVCRNVLQCVAACCGAVQCVAGCCSVLQSVSNRFMRLRDSTCIYSTLIYLYVPV